jgi:RNA polymerase sigma-70 factor (ECF subfamily)
LRVQPPAHLALLLPGRDGSLRLPREGIRPSERYNARLQPLREEDIQLVARARAGDERAFRALLEKYERAVFSICLRMVRNRDEASDLAQESFIKVFGSLDRYNPEYAFSSWLFKITSNLCIDHLRKRRITTFAMEDPVESEKGEYTRQYVSPDPPPRRDVFP